MICSSVNVEASDADSYQAGTTRGHESKPQPLRSARLLRGRCRANWQATLNPNGTLGDGVFGYRNPSNVEAPSDWG